MLNPYRPENAIISSTKKETYDVKTYTFAFEREQSDFSFRPGQFIMLSIFGIGEAPFSLCSNPDDNETLTSTIRNVGNVTRVLDGLSEGDIVGVRGPYGTSWPLEEARKKNILIVAGGIGIAPLRALIMYVANNRHNYRDIEILYGARKPDDLVFTDEFKNWASIENTNLLLTVDSVPKRSQWAHNVGVVTTLFEKMNTTSDNTVIMTCGPEIMMRFVVKGLVNRGFMEDQIFVSLERQMKCGIGICGHCQLGTKFVCKEGPVFRLSEIVGLPDNML
jgi:NAD(P)H-flavin reductase